MIFQESYRVTTLTKIVDKQDIKRRESNYITMKNQEFIEKDINRGRKKQ